MTVDVDPFIHNYPGRFTDRDGNLTFEANVFMKYMVRFLRDLRDRTGGSNDFIFENDAQIIINKNNIAINAANIATNTTNIATNTADILDLQGADEEHEQLISSLLASVGAVASKGTRLSKGIADNKQLISEVMAQTGRIISDNSSLFKDAKDRDQLIAELIAREGDASSFKSRINKREFKEVNLGAAVTAYTTTRNEIINCDNTSSLTVTLNASPWSLQEVKVKRRSAAVRVSGTIDGATFIDIGAVYDAPTFIFGNLISEWGQF